MNEKRVAIVTGGSRGIGAAIVRRLAKDGLHVVAVARNLDKLQDVCGGINAEGGSSEALTCDIADTRALAAAIEQVGDRHGRLDVLVNNAGITRDGLFLRMSDEDFDSVLDTNLKSAFVAIRTAGRQIMRSKTGRIINISSVAGVAGNAGQANYSASKAGLIGLTKSVAKEFASRNILANVIAPGFIETDMTAAMTADARATLSSQIPLERLGTPRDIAGIAAFLASEHAAYITGQVFVVDGGMVM
jgi:3-oxoacyl-[acyl-carrier protein] reductase